MILVRLLAAAVLLLLIYDGSRGALAILLGWIVGTMELHGIAWRRTVRALVEAERWRARAAVAEQLGQVLGGEDRP